VEVFVVEIFMVELFVVEIFVVEIFAVESFLGNKDPEERGGISTPTCLHSWATQYNTV
jgi:hypothetical protein